MRRGLVSVCVVGAVLAAGGLGAGCSDDGGEDGDGTAVTDPGTSAAPAGDVAGGRLSLAGLAATTDACPLDLGAAVEGAGLAPTDGASVRVDVGSSGDDDGEADSALDDFGGTYVQCAQPVDGGQVTVALLATEQSGAFNLLLPQVMQDLDQAFDEAEALAERAADVAPGELIDLGPNAPVAAGVLAVEGASSAVLYVDAVDSPRPEQAQSIATRLLDQA